MTVGQEIIQIRECGQKLTQILNLDSKPVGVRFIKRGEASSFKGEQLQQHRYCQALMKARRGANVILDDQGIACPAAASAFGFRPLPESLKSGQGLVGFGIVSDPVIGRRMFEGMPHLDSGKVKQLELFPLDSADESPDVVVVEGPVESLMWINLAYLNVSGGERLKGSTAILQATCVDSTIIPFLEDRLNFGFGCYGCREATDLTPQETVVGFPVRILVDLVKALEYLAKKAIPNSRSKRVYQSLQKHEATG